MADAPQAATKDAPAEAAAGAKPKTPGKLKGLIGPLLAVVVILLIGAGAGAYVSSLLKGVQAGAATEHKVEVKHESGPTLEMLHEITLPDLISNVRNQQGRRYIKVNCAILVHKEDAEKMGFSEGGGHGGGKGGGSEVKRIMQMALEEHLKGYDLDELTGPNIYVQLKKGFQDQLEKALRDLFPEFPPDHHFVEKVVLTNLLVQ